MRIKGIIRPGHGVASGICDDPRYPEGTLKEQLPYFKENGLELSPYYLGTINLDISPLEFKINKPLWFLENINWSDHIPAENFYFFDVIALVENSSYKGLIYMPDPKTKVEHEQKRTVLELILPKIEGINYGDSIQITVPPNQITFHYQS